MGWATPQRVERVVGAVRERWPELALRLHLHDTRGLGIANAMAGLRLGVVRYDSTVGAWAAALRRAQRRPRQHRHRGAGAPL
ncbi:hypothetical protein ACFQU7_32725 [Pseudoroseomonas wenyumeiae]